MRAFGVSLLLGTGTFATTNKLENSFMFPSPFFGDARVILSTPRNIDMPMVDNTATIQFR